MVQMPRQQGKSLIQYTALLYQALSTPYGIEVVVVSGSVSSARQKLYAARRAAMDPALAQLQFRASPHNPTQAIWITKGGQPDGEEEYDTED